MYGGLSMSAPSLHRESILCQILEVSIFLIFFIMLITIFVKIETSRIGIRCHQYIILEVLQPIKFLGL